MPFFTKVYGSHWSSVLALMRERFSPRSWFSAAIIALPVLG